MDRSLPGSSVHGILQARIPEWVAIPFSRGSSWPRDQTRAFCIASHQGSLFMIKVKVKSLSHVRLFVTPWTVAYQAPPSMGFSRQECWSGLPFPSPRKVPPSQPRNRTRVSCIAGLRHQGSPIFMIKTDCNSGPPECPGAWCLSPGIL